MLNFDTTDKEALQALVEAGATVMTVAYNPTTVTGTPEADAITAGFSVHYREDTASLVEVIFIKS